MQEVQKKRAQTKEKASTRKVIAAETRPRVDMHGKCQTLPQGTLPEQGGTSQNDRGMQLSSPTGPAKI